MKTLRIKNLFLKSTFGTLIFLLFFTSSVFAADGDLNSPMELYDMNGNGKVDRVVVEITNSGTATACVNSTAGWAATDNGGASTVDITDVTLASVANANPQIFHLTLDENDVAVDTVNADLEISYTQVGVDNGTEWRRGIGEVQTFATGDAGNTTELDKISPILLSSAIHDEDNDGLLDRIDFIFSEDLMNYNEATTSSFYTTSASDFGTITNGATDCGGYNGSLDNGCSYYFTPSNVKTDTGDLTVDYTDTLGLIVDLNSNAAADFTLTTTDFTDRAKPVPVSAEVFDTDLNGKLDLITTTWSENLWPIQDGTADWSLASSPGGHYAGLVEGTVECNYGNAAANECDYNFTTTTKRTDLTSDLTLDYLATNTTVKDSSNNQAAAVDFNKTLSTIPLEDKAAPVILDFAYQDLVSARNGKIDQMKITFSEDLHGNSVIAPNDLIFTNVGDFTGLTFGTNAVSVDDGDSDALMTLGTEPDEIDTFSTLSMAVSSKNAFHLEDADGNINDTLQAQDQASFTDEAHPIIKDMAYQDDDKDGMIDQMLVTFSEEVTGNSVLGAADLIFSNGGADVGDFTGAAFGSIADDQITANTTTATIVLGTEATVTDTKENSGSIDVTTQNNFKLIDVALNQNTNLEDQLPVTFIDDAAPAPILNNFEDTTVVDGKLDLITILWSEDVDPVTSGTGDFTVSGSDFFPLTNGTVDCGGVAPAASNECVYNFSTPVVRTDAGNLNLAYSGTSVTDGTNETEDIVSFALTDGAKPYPVSATFYDDAVANGILDRIRVLWSEDIQDPGAIGNWDATGGDFAGINETAVNCGGNNGEPANACDIDISTTTQKTDVGNLQLTYTVGAGNVLDLIGNVAGNQTFNDSSDVPLSDGAKPYPASATILDPDNDGFLDLITVVWTEPIEEVADASAEWQLTSAANFAFPLAYEGTVECNYGVADSNECDYNFTTTTAKTNVGDLNLAYTAGSVSDGINSADSITFTDSSTPAFTDGAAPAFLSASADSDTNINIVMTEPVDLVVFGGAADWTATDDSSAAAITPSNAAIKVADSSINLTVASMGNTAFTSSDFAFDTSVGGDIQDAASNATLPFSGKTINDSQRPSISSGYLNIDDSACTGTSGECIIGDTMTFTWDNTVASGDGNTDIDTVVARLINFAGPAAQVLYDNGTHGDVQIGDDIYTYNYTVVPGVSDFTFDFSVIATDSNSNTSLEINSTDVAAVDNVAPVIGTPGVLTLSLDNNSNSVAEIGDQVTYADAGETSGDTIASYTVDLSQLTGDAAATQALSPYTVLPGILNTTYAFTETVTDDAGNTTTGLVNAITIDNASGSGFSDASVGISNLNASTSTDAVISFDSSLDFPLNGKIVLTFPAGFDVSGVDTITDASNIVDTELSIGISGQTVTLTHNSAADIPAGTIISFKLSPVVTPDSGGLTGNFSLATKTSADINLSSITTLPGVTIIPPADPTPAPTPAPNTTVVGGGGGGNNFFVRLQDQPVAEDGEGDEEEAEHEAAPVVSASTVAFRDTFGHWAKSYIDRIAAMGIVEGKTPTQYAPNDNITRAEILKIALKSFNHAVAESVSQNPLPDVDADAWYAPFVKSAFENRIIYGFSQGLEPNSPASRGMAVTVITKAAGFKDVDQHFADNYANKADWTFAQFPDVKIDSYYAPFVAYLFDKGIINGYEDGTFGPGNPITRAEIAKIVVNVLDFLTNQ